MISNDTLVIILGVALVVVSCFAIYFYMNSSKSSYNPREEHDVSQQPAPEARPQPAMIPPFSGVPLNKQVGPGEPVLVMFWSNGCAPCANMKPSWVQACQILMNSIKLADCESADPNIQHFDIKGFPTVRLFPQGLDHIDNFIEYKGDRSPESLARFAESRGQAV